MLQLSGTIQTYTMDFMVQQEDCDIFNQMMPAAFLRKAQQASIQHCNLAGLTQQCYQQTQTVFLMAKVAVQILKPVYAEQILTIKTMPFAPKRVSYHRFSTFFDSQGTPVAQYDSRWILVDLNTRRILRTPPKEMQFPFLNPVSQELDLSFEKATNLQQWQLNAGYSLCDCNGHINHTRYADIICNCLPPNLLQQNRISKMVLTYHQEVCFGEDFVLQAGFAQPDQFYANIQKQNKNATECGLWLLPR